MHEAAAWIYSDEAIAGGVVALGLGGNEAGHPPEWFEEPFRKARERGLPANPHAGELEGAASIRGAIDTLKARRIGHGVRAIEDPELVRYLAENQIPLEVNPTSNLCLNVYPSYEAHPLQQLIEARCIVTINSDDPPLFNTTLTDEYIHAVEDCGLTIEQLEETVLNGIRYSYLPDDEKTTMEADFRGEFARLRQSLKL
jgi:adenosine deaminase